MVDIKTIKLPLLEQNVLLFFPGCLSTGSKQISRHSTLKNFSKTRSQLRRNKDAPFTIIDSTALRDMLVKLMD